MRSRSVHTCLVAAVSVVAAASIAGAVTATAQTDVTGAAALSSAHVPGHVLVHFSSDASAADQAALEHANSASVIGRIGDLGVDVLKVPVGAEQHVIDALLHSGRATVAELDGVGHVSTTPDDTYWSSQWGLQKINAPTAWSTTTGSSSVVMADLDSGIDFAHRDLQGKTVAGYDFVNNDVDPTDDGGHGTATAGIIGADSNNALGVAGMCWTCSIMPVKVVNSSGSVAWSTAASGITWATDHGARVINMSFAGTSGSSTLQSAVQYALDRNVVVVAAAGNNGNATPVYPANYSGVISVAGSTSADALYSWSDYGSWVDVAAPGCDYSTAMGGGYSSSFCGTSAAAPVVTGLAGLLVSSAPGASQSSIATAIESSATPIGSSVVFGRVDAAAALTALSSGGTSSPPAPSPSPSPSASPSSGPPTTTAFSGSLNGKTSSRSYSVTAGAGAVSASLSYTRATTMTLQLVDESGSVVDEASGGSPVTVSATVPAGTYKLVVSSSDRASYTLSVTYSN